jgi:hypothetical protein
METALQFLNKKHFVPFAMVVFVLFTIIMAAGCLINYNTTFSSFNARIPYTAAIAATFAVQVVQFAIPILAAWKIFEFLGWDRRVKISLFVIWAVVSSVDILTAFYWFVSARQDVMWLDYVIATAMSLWFYFAEYGVVLGVIGMLVAFSLMKYNRIPAWLLTAGEPAVADKPMRKIDEGLEACETSILDSRMTRDRPLPPLVSTKPSNPKPTPAPAGVMPRKISRTTREGNIICWCDDGLMYWFMPGDTRLKDLLTAQA